MLVLDFYGVVLGVGLRFYSLKMEISYKIPMGYIKLILLGSFVMVLGSFGYLGDSFNQTRSINVLSLWCFFGSVAYFLMVSPRNRKVIANDAGVYVPSIFLPFTSDASCKWDDILDYSFNYKAHYPALVLHTSHGDIKIYSFLCFRDGELDILASDFLELKEYIVNKLSDANDSMDANDVPIKINKDARSYSKADKNDLGF
ncbi:hypothetical protein [Microbulbifer sp. ZKSA002]|uniref:hypothetical protein n=1 Tax=Microbulbifer sp. ZKSA002 TaxID=3243388 RepID=UPI004039BD89